MKNFKSFFIFQKIKFASSYLILEFENWNYVLNYYQNHSHYCFNLQKIKQMYFFSFCLFQLPLDLYFSIIVIYHHFIYAVTNFDFYFSSLYLMINFNDFREFKLK